MVKKIKLLEKYVDYLKVKVKLENPEKSTEEVDEFIMEMMKEGEDEAKEKINMLIDKYDDTQQKIERINYREKKILKEGIINI